MSTDSDLIAASAGDPDVFGQLFDRHAARVHRYVARRADWLTAQDVVAETFVVAFRTRSRYDAGRSDALPWLLGIATNQLRRHQRSQARWHRAATRLRPADAADDQTARVDDRLSANRSLGLIQDALARMPAIDRDTVLLFAWGGLSYDQVAEAMAVPVGTVRSRLNRARRRLRAVLHTADPHPPGEHHERDPAPFPFA